jgi:DnaJ-class molecular chaperone
VSRCLGCGGGARNTPHRSWCPEDHTASRVQRWRARQKAAHLCRDCGGNCEPGHVRCAVCAAEHAARERARYARTR